MSSGVEKAGFSTGLSNRVQDAERQLNATEAGRAAFRIRLVKMVCMVVLGVCFWYSVPYRLPLKLDPDPAKAAANEAAAYEGNVSRQVAMPVVAALVLFMWWRLPKRGRFRGRLLWTAVMYCGWVAVSFLWSEAPATTGKRLIVFAIDAGFAVTLARTFSVIEMAAFGFAVTSTVAMISLYVDVLQERLFAPFDPDYRFMGVMTANYQAMNLLVSMVCALTLAQKRPKWIKWIVPFIGFELVLMYLTRSRLSAVICVVLLTIMGLRMARERTRVESRALLLLGCLAVAAPVMVYVVGNRGTDVARTAFMMGRTDVENTSTLSNRAPLWAEVMESVMTRPWIGFGYAGFWVPERVERISFDQGWMVPNSHNTYLDQVLSVGVIGALLYTGLLWGGCVLAWQRYRRDPTPESLFPAVLLTWLALTGLLESTPLDPYLPTLLAYSCLAKMAMEEGSERESERGTDNESIIGGGPLAQLGTSTVDA